MARAISKAILERMPLNPHQREITCLIYPRLGLSPRRRLPVLYAWTNDLRPLDAIRFMWGSRGWKGKARNGIVECWHLGDHFFLDPYVASITILEWGTWLKTYSPARGMKGLAVLDVGAGCGETCHFFLKQGASKVIAIESNHWYAGLLRKNSEMNHWNVEVAEGPFLLDYLKQFEFDFMKVDIEGAEERLLSLDSLPETILESHSPELTERFMQKFQMRILGRGAKSSVALLTNMSEE